MILTPCRQININKYFKSLRLLSDQIPRECFEQREEKHKKGKAAGNGRKKKQIALNKKPKRKPNIGERNKYRKRESETLMIMRNYYEINLVCLKFSIYIITLHCLSFAILSKLNWCISLEREKRWRKNG